MELITADQGSVTIRFEDKELTRLLSIVHTAGAQYAVLDSEFLNLSFEQVEEIENSLFDLAGKASVQVNRG